MRFFTLVGGPDAVRVVLRQEDLDRRCCIGAVATSIRQPLRRRRLTPKGLLAHYHNLPRRGYTNRTVDDVSTLCNPFGVEMRPALDYPGCAARPWAMECNRFAVKTAQRQSSSVGPVFQPSNIARSYRRAFATDRRFRVDRETRTVANALESPSKIRLV